MTTCISLFILPNTDHFHAHCQCVGKGQGYWQDQSMTIASSSGLSNKDIEKVVADAEQFTKADNGAFRLHVPVLGMPICCLKALNKQQQCLAAQTQPGNSKR